jgi:predicted lactoylglutathione lyase
MKLRTRRLFVNLAVEDLERSRRFFERLGFVFDEVYSNDRALCMVLSAEACVMLLTRDFFGGFTNREICVTRTHTEALLAIACDSREEVDEFVSSAVAAGGTLAQEPQDQGFMYAWSFYDPDGHHWEVFWMSPDLPGKEPAV